MHYTAKRMQPVKTWDNENKDGGNQMAILN